jgi:hypothetical protein
MGNACSCNFEKARKIAVPPFPRLVYCTRNKFRRCSTDNSHFPSLLFLCLGA